VAQTRLAPQRRLERALGFVAPIPVTQPGGHVLRRVGDHDRPGPSGPEEAVLRERLGEHGTFLGWLSGAELPSAYASADAFLFASRTDTFGQVILEAQASGLPVVAVAEGGPTSLIADGETGLLAEPSPEALADALLSVVRTPALRERLRKTALATVKERTWNASLRQLAAGYRSALLRSAVPGRARAAYRAGLLV
jgi:glycosyltransferase involved in cell wall biosynthesis